jgi:hypothetical protein
MSGTSTPLSEDDVDQSIANFRKFAEKLGDPNFTEQEEIFYNKDPKRGSPLSYGYATFSNYAVPEDASGNTIQVNKQPITSIIMLDSRDRDRNVYPQPTNLTLRLPRTYANVTNFQVVQLKLLSAFFYFRNDKHNTDISILETGRTITTKTGQVVPDIVKSFIREGTYDINSLLTELTTQLNYTPVFYDYPNGFQDFAPRFASTGDYSLNFNYPGDTFYDSLLNQYIPNPTMTLIVSKYFQSQFAGLSSYSTDQMKVAYYYPVLKEYLLDDEYLALNPLNLTLTTSAQYLLPTETVTSRCVYTFQGINDPVILEVVNNNILLLNQYRLEHTFRYYLVNKYVITYETNSNRITFSCPSLNTSLLNLLNYKYNQFFLEQLSQNNITQTEYNTLKTENTILLAVLNDMFYYLEKYLAVYFGIGFNSFSLNYIANPLNILPLRDATQAIGISSNFDVNVLTNNVIPQDTNLLEQLRQDPPKYWTGLTSLPQSTYPYPYNLETGDPTTSSNYPFSLVLDRQDRDHSFVNTSNHQVYANQLTRYADIVVPIEPTKYTVFKFTSPVRQTLEVQTLPRPTKYRYPAYNTYAVSQGLYTASNAAIFDNSYSFVEYIQNANMDTLPSSNLILMPGLSSLNTTSNFGIDLSTSRSYWQNTPALIFTGNTRVFYEFYSPNPPSPPSAPAYRYPLALTVENATGTTFSEPIEFFLYHDRGAFMADISSNRTESKYNPISTMSLSTTVSSLTLTFDAYANEHYYILARSQGISPTSQGIYMVPWFPNGMAYTSLSDSLVGFDPLANPQTPAALSNIHYATVADPAFLHLPIQSTIQNTPVLQSNDVALTFSTVAMGYDVSGVSTDLTHYIPYIQASPTSNVYPPSPISIDPISGYIFKSDNGYNSTFQSYVYPGSGNVFLTANGVNVYTPRTVPYRQYTLAHYYTNTYLPNSINQFPIPPADVVDPTYIAPFTETSAGTPRLNGYFYGGSNQAIQFGDGVLGFSILPSQGVWDIDHLMFKSIYTNSNADPNREIVYLGIYYTSAVAGKLLGDIALSNAIAVLKVSKAVTYNSANSNFGFDAVGGTYYEFIRDSNFNTGPLSYLYGYTQNFSTFNNDPNSIYSVIPFDGAYTLKNFQGLAGSLVPYPYFSDASGAAAYYDGTQAMNSRDVVVPVTKASPDLNRGPPPGGVPTQSRYQQSMPIGTNHLQYVNPYIFANNSNPFTAWNPLPYAPSLLVADVSGYMLTQDTFYRVFQFSTNTTNYDFTETYQFTIDQVYPPSPDINFIGLAANEREYAFFAYSNAASPSLPGSLLIRTMNPGTGLITNCNSYDLSYNLNTWQVTNFTYNNYGGYTLSLKTTTDIAAYCQHTSSPNTYTTFTEVGSHDPDIEKYITLQSPKEEGGKFYICPVRTSLGSAIQEYGYVDPTVPVAGPDPNYAYSSITMSSMVVQSPTVNIYLLPNTDLYRTPAVTRQLYRDYLIFGSVGTTQNFYQVTGYGFSNDSAHTSNAIAEYSVYSFPNTIPGFYAGANGGLWTVFGDVPYGNRFDFLDAPRFVDTAWQIFYPAQRTVFRQIAKNFSFMYDLSGLTWPEFPHTALIAYDSASKLAADTGTQWGLESSGNFVVADFRFSGYTFNSKIFTVPLYPTTPSNPYYYLAVRGYSPTEKSQVLMRFSLTNRYDLGFMSLGDVSNEIVLAQTDSHLFAPEYASLLASFNSNFIFDSNGVTFGGGVIPGYGGSNFTNVTGFADFYGRFIQVYNQYNSAIQTINIINSNTQSNLNSFIQSELQYILPSSALNRQRYTDPLIFSILWKSSLLPEYVKLEEEWGLGWNLGFVKEDTDYQTVHRADSFFKILEDYIYLRLNPEYDMNRMDTGAKENLSQTLEPRGATKAYHAKLLLATFGNYAQTLVSNPLSFSPPLGRIDKLTFQWLNVANNIINNADCEWNMVIQISESQYVAEIPKPMQLDPSARVSGR